MIRVSLQQRGEVWYARWWDPVAQTDRRRSLRTIDERQARRAAIDLEEELEREAAEPGPRYALSLDALVQRFLRAQKQRVSRGWLDQQASHLAAFQRHCRIREARRIRASHARAFLSSLRKAPATANRYRASLSALFSWAWREELVPENPIAKTRQRREDRRVVVYLQAEERGRLLERVAGTRLEIPVGLGMLAGLRRGEICALRWGDVEEDWVVVRRSRRRSGRDGPVKNRRERRVPLSTRLASMLAERGRPAALVAQRTTNHGWTPAALTQAVGRLGRDLGIPALRGPQVLRRTAATHWLAGGVTLSEVAWRLGDTIQVTERNYAGFVSGGRA